LTWPVKKRLVCAEASYVANDPNISLANCRDVPVVTYDWLEDSTHKGRKLSEKKFTLEKLMKDKAKADKARAKDEGPKLKKDGMSLVTLFFAAICFSSFHQIIADTLSFVRNSPKVQGWLQRRPFRHPVW
jgi:hypothetical protein